MKRLVRVLLVAVALVNGWLLLRVLLPLRRLSAEAERVSEGDLDALKTTINGVHEVETLRRSMLAMSGHVRRAQSQTRTLAEAMTNGQEAERARLARELHDDTVQSLVAIGQVLDMAQSWLARDPQKATAMLKMAREQSTTAVLGLRDLIADLRPPALDELGLAAALNMLAKRYPQVHFQIETQGVVRRLDDAFELTLFRAAQEAINNACRHGGAHEVNVHIDFEANGVRLIVRDDGYGFVPPSDLTEFAKSGHFGLVGIQERVANLHGRLDIVSAPESGTRVEIYVPLPESLQPRNVVRDPVCSALIESNQAYGSVEHNGERYYFCCPVCRGAFQRDPEAYLQTS